jgi:hypothetical protein
MVRREHDSGGDSLSLPPSLSLFGVDRFGRGQSSPIFGAARRPDREWVTHFSISLEKEFKFFWILGDRE